MPTLNWADKKRNLLRAAQVPVCALHEILCHGNADTDNLLIKGDNLLALKTLASRYAGTVKCIYIDPPFNTGADFEHYQDNFKHTTWLTNIYPRLQAMRTMLSDKGSIWVSIDNRELSHLKIIMDEIFGRKNFVNLITNTTAPSGFKTTSDSIFAGANYICVYAKKREMFEIKKQFVEREFDKAYTQFLENPDEHYSKWEWGALKDKFAATLGYETTKDAKKKIADIFGDADVAEYAFNKAMGDFAVVNAKHVFRIAAFTGGAKIKREKTINLSSNEKGKIFVHEGEDQGYHILNGGRIIFYNKTLISVDNKVVPGRAITDVWTDINWVGIAREGGVTLNNGKKPERLIERILNISTNPDDIVLDCFLGSGTTAAVAHKMGRRWLGIEMGEQAETHCVKRLCDVVHGKDKSGISESVKWCGGGGFRFLQLGKEVFDDKGEINDKVDFETLAAYLWFSTTDTPLALKKKSAFLGEHKGVGYALLYNGILDDKSIDSGNIITTQTLAAVRHSAPKNFLGKIIIYASGCRFEQTRMDVENIEFRHVPYDCKK